MNRAILVLALVTSAFLTVHVNGQTAASRMTMSTIQAMVSGGVPLPTIVQTIRTAKKIDFYINDRERSRLMEAGATAGDVAQIFDAIHYREYMNVDAHIVVPPAPAPAMTVPVVAASMVAAAPVGPVAAAAPVASVAVVAPMAPAAPVAPVTTVVPFAPRPEPAPVAAAPARPVLPVVETLVRPTVLENSTPVRLRLSHNLSSADASADQTVDFEVIEAVKVGDMIVIPKGAIASGTVTDVERRKRTGHGGKVELNVESVRLPDGEKVPLRGVKTMDAGDHIGNATNGVVATSLMFWPAAPVLLMTHGKDATIAGGTEITAYVNGRVTLDTGKILAQPAQLTAAR
jgi:hypothetical protein